MLWKWSQEPVRLASTGISAFVARATRENTERFGDMDDQGRSWDLVYGPGARSVGA